MRKEWALAIFVLTFSLLQEYTSCAFASLRGEAPTVIGDARQIGLSGATLASPSSVHTAIENPANAHFGKWAASISLLNDTIHDDRMNFDGEYRKGEGVGIVASTPVFGLYVGHRLPAQESASIGRVSVQETHLGIAAAVGPRISLGVAGIITKVDWEGFDTTPTNASNWSLIFGARAIVTENWVVGLSFRPLIPVQQSTNSGIYSLIEVPARLTLGATLLSVPRFQFHFGLSTFGQQKEAIELGNPMRKTGRSISFQPRIGVEFNLYQSDLIQFDLYAGSYLEPPRIDDLCVRPHLTGGAGLKVWAGRASIGMDGARGYSNVVSWIGVDFIDFAVKMKSRLTPESSTKLGE